MNNEINKCISSIFNGNSLETCEKKWKAVSQTLFDYIKNEEKLLGIPRSKEVLPQLFINNMTAEQIWQQIEFQNEFVIPMKSEVVSDNTQNLCYKIAQLCNQASNDDDDNDDGVETGDSEVDDTDDDEGEIGGSEVDDDGVETAGSEFDEPENNDNEDNDIDRNSNISTSLDEDEAIEEDIAKSGEDLDSDLDKDTFGDIALESDEEEEEEEKEEYNEDIDEDNLHEEENIEDKGIGNQTKEFKPLPENFSSTTVDTKFFNLRQCEYIADNDIIGEDAGDNIDLMKDLDSEEEEEELMYDNFFDPPDQHSEKDEEENGSKVKSKFAAKLDEETALKRGLEEETFLAEKPWIFKGEVQKSDRPENSTLQHHLEANVAVRMNPVITEEINQKIEGLILGRIKNQFFDDVERKIKPVVDPTRFKEKLILDQEKSNKSLAAIYEEEYLKKQQETEGKEETLHSVLSEGNEKHEELPIHKEIKKEMENAFMKLDALFNYHFTPKYKPPEVKVVRNVPAISIEESTPAVISDATLLAPQEIVAPIRGELKGDTEKEKTDRNRERRGKKKHQKLRAKREEDKLRLQMNKRDKDGLMQTEASIKLVQKALKKGQVKVLDNKQKAIKSSKAFFTEIQDNLGSRTKKRKAEDSSTTDGTGKKKKKSIPKTMSKLLL